jgi:hypothetical protein
MYEQAAKSRDLRENAELQLQLMQVEEEKKQFAKVAEAFEAKRYPQAIRAAEEFRRKYPGSDLARQAATTIELARFQMKRETQMRPAQADAVYQNAERLLLQDRLTESLEQVNRLEIDYGETPSGKRANALRDRIMLKLRERGATIPRTTPSTAVAETSVPDSETQRLDEMRRLSQGTHLPARPTPPNPAP